MTAAAQPSSCVTRVRERYSWRRLPRRALREQLTASAPPETLVCLVASHIGSSGRAADLERMLAIVATTMAAEGIRLV